MIRKTLTIFSLLALQDRIKKDLSSFGGSILVDERGRQERAPTHGLPRRVLNTTIEIERRTNPFFVR